MRDEVLLHVPSEAAELPPDWSWKRLDKVCDGVFDCPHSTPALSELGPYLARSQDIRSGVFRTDQAAHVSESTYNARIARAEPRHGDLLYSREGTYFGIAAEVPAGVRVCLGQRMVLIRPDRSEIVSSFLRYWLNSPAMALHTSGRRDGSVAERLNLPTIRALPIAVPPLSEQRAIACILGTLDDKIQLNWQMSETLHAMARALFQSWFVDFDPVRAKTEGRDPGLPKPLADLFPTRLVDSELGELPEGWKLCTVADLCSSIFSGGTPNTRVTEYWDGDIAWLSSGETRDAFIVTTERRITPEGVSKSSTRLVPALSTVIASAGQGNTRGQTSLIGFDAYINQSIVALRANLAKSSAFHLFFDLERRYDEFRRISDGHSSRGSLTTTLLAASPAVLPPRVVIESFDRLVGLETARIFELRRESQTLAALRDAMLPKLISGELRVKDAEQVVNRSSA